MSHSLPQLTPPPLPSPPPVSWADLTAQRSYLVRFARHRLMDPALAEDLVHDVFEAVVSGRAAFAGRAALRTWLVGILKHKVLDQMRAHAREACDPGTSPDDLADPLDDLPLNERGHFSEQPADWGNPEQDLSRRQLADVLELCTDRLPAAQGRAFMMREWLEMSVDDICKELGVSSTNLYVLLHRARLRLRACLELNWLGHRHPA